MVWFNIFSQVIKNTCKLFWSRKANCIRNINIWGTSINCCLNNFSQEIKLSTSSIFRRKLNNFKFWTCIWHMFFYSFKNFFFWFLQFKLTVNRTCRDKDMNLWILSIFQSFITSINIRFYWTSQASNRSCCHSFCNLFYCFKWIWASCRETSFNYRNSPFFKLLSNSNFFFDWEVNTRCLFPITKTCIKKFNFTHRQSSF